MTNPSSGEQRPNNERPRRRSGLLAPAILTAALAGALASGNVRDKIGNFFHGVGNFFNPKPGVEATVPANSPIMAAVTATPQNPQTANRFLGLDVVQVSHMLELQNCGFKPTPIQEQGAPVKDRVDGYALTQDFQPFTQSTAQFIQDNILLKSLGYNLPGLENQVKGQMADAISRGLTTQSLYTVSEDSAAVVVSQSKGGAYDLTTPQPAGEVLDLHAGDQVAFGFFLTERNGEFFMAGTVKPVFISIVKAGTEESCGYNSAETATAVQLTRYYQQILVSARYP